MKWNISNELKPSQISHQSSKMDFKGYNQRELKSLIKKVHHQLTKPEKHEGVTRGNAYPLLRMIDDDA